MAKFKTENVRLACQTANEMFQLADRLNKFGSADSEAYPLLKQADVTMAWEDSATIYEKAMILVREIVEQLEERDG